MALNAAGYTAAGAGITAANGNYVPVTGAYATYQGATQYTNGTYFIAYSGGGYYYLENSVVYQNSSGLILYAVSGASTTNFPLTGWSTSGGTAPAPTFADMSTGGGGTTARRRPPIFF